MAKLKLYRSQVWMTMQYQRNRLSAEQIAEICHCDVKTVYRYLRQFNLLRDK